MESNMFFFMAQVKVAKLRHHPHHLQPFVTVGHPFERPGGVPFPKKFGPSIPTRIVPAQVGVSGRPGPPNGGLFVRDRPRKFQGVLGEGEILFHLARCLYIVTYCRSSCEEFIKNGVCYIYKEYNIMYIFRCY